VDIKPALSIWLSTLPPPNPKPWLKVVFFI
jgi:hypothetical protein